MRTRLASVILLLICTEGFAPATARLLRTADDDDASGETLEVFVEELAVDTDHLELSDAELLALEEAALAQNITLEEAAAALTTVQNHLAGGPEGATGSSSGAPTSSSLATEAAAAQGWWESTTGLASSMWDSIKCAAWASTGCDGADAVDAHARLDYSEWTDSFLGPADCSANLYFKQGKAKTQADCMALCESQLPCSGFSYYFDTGDCYLSSGSGGEVHRCPSERDGVVGWYS